jgi:hypothetical protein
MKPKKEPEFIQVSLGFVFFFMMTITLIPALAFSMVLEEKQIFSHDDAGIAGCLIVTLITFGMNKQTRIEKSSE